MDLEKEEGDGVKIEKKYNEEILIVENNNLMLFY